MKRPAFGMSRAGITIIPASHWAKKIKGPSASGECGIVGISKNAKKGIYTALLLNGNRDSYLADVNEQAEGMLSRLVSEMMEREGVTERLKAENQMEWIRRVNNIRNRAREMVNADLIYV